MASQFSQIVEKTNQKFLDDLHNSLKKVVNLVVSVIPGASLTAVALKGLAKIAVPTLINILFQKRLAKIKTNKTIDECKPDIMLDNLVHRRIDTGTNLMENQYTILNEILKEIFKKSNDLAPSIESLKLEIISLEDESIKKEIFINTENEDETIDQLYDNIKNNLLFQKLNELYANLMPDPEKKNNVFTDSNCILNQLFIILITLILKLNKNEDIPEFDNDSMEFGPLTKVSANNTKLLNKFGLNTNKINKQTSLIINEKIKKLFILQELVHLKSNQLTARLKTDINNLLFLSQTEINKRSTDEEKELTRDEQSLIEMDTAAIGLTIKTSLAKKGVQDSINRRLDDIDLDQISDEPHKILKTLMVLNKKENNNFFNIHGTSSKSSMKYKFYASKALANKFTIESYGEYLSYLLMYSSEVKEYKLIETAEKLLNDIMIEQNNNTPVIIIDSNSKKNKNPKIQNETTYKGILTLTLNTGFTITVEQVGILTFIIPNLISGLFIDLYELICTNLSKKHVNPYDDKTHIQQLYLESLTVNIDNNDDLCKLSLLTISNNIVPLYNMLYRSLINLYVPVNFDMLLEKKNYAANVIRKHAIQSLAGFSVNNSSFAGGKRNTIKKKRKTKKYSIKVAKLSK